MRHNALWVAAVAVLGQAAGVAAWGQGTWRGLVVAPENRCAPYNSDDYGYSQTLERAAIAAMGGPDLWTLLRPDLLPTDGHRHRAYSGAKRGARFRAMCGG